MSKGMRAVLGLLVSVLVAALVVGWIVITQGADWVPEASTPPGSTGEAEPGAETQNPTIPDGATQAVVEYVHDGDTLFLEDGRKVRLLGVDTPEIGKNLACYGPEATALLKQLLPEGTTVWVLEDVEPRDQYGRSLLFVYTEDGTNVNLELLRRGAAQVEMYRPNLLFQDEIEAAERAARDAGLGLWGSCT